MDNKLEMVFTAAKSIPFNTDIIYNIRADFLDRQSANVHWCGNQMDPDKSNITSQ